MGDSQRGHGDRFATRRKVRAPDTLGAMLLLALLLSGCGLPNACERYVGAVATCATAHGGSASLYDPHAVCADWDDAHDDHYGVYYDCRTAALVNADCTTDDGFAAALAAEACCAPPGATSTDSGCTSGD